VGRREWVIGVHEIQWFIFLIYRKSAKIGKRSWSMISEKYLKITNCNTA
jgi:hypothetical protein